MRGVTLIELLVVLAILGVMTGVSTLAIGSLRRPVASHHAEVLVRARAAAIRTGRALTVPAESGGSVRFLPDGRGLGPGVDLLTGDVLDARR